MDTARLAAVGWQFQGFIPSKLQTVAISYELDCHIVKMCALGSFNDKMSDYHFLTQSP